MIFVGCSSKETVVPVTSKKLQVKNNDMRVFESSLKNKILYESDFDNIKAGVIPHHLTAANMISGFFDLASKNKFDKFDTVIIIAPNHDGDLGDVIISNANWDFYDGVYNDNEFYEIIKKMDLKQIKMITDNDRVEQDHSASVHIPYVEEYFPEAKVFPILVSKTLSLDDTLLFSDVLNKSIDLLDKKVLLICSIDFSHFLTKSEALKNDVITLDTIKNKNYHKLFSFSNEYIDSPSSMIIFLEYLKKHDLTLEVLDNKDGTDFSDVPSKDTTSYFVFAGVK